MYLTAFQLRQALQGFLAVLVPKAEHGEGHQYLVGVQAWVAAMQVVDFGGLNRLDHGLWDEFHLMRNARDMLGGVQYQGGAGTEQVAGMGRDEGAVFQLNGSSCHTFLFLAVFGGNGSLAVSRGDFSLLHQQGNLVHLVFGAFALGKITKRRIITPYDFLFGSFAAHRIVAQTIAYHIDAHIGRRLVGILTIDALEDGVQHGEDLDVAVVVDGGLAVGLQVERVDHIHVAEVSGGGFVGHVDGVFQRQVPHGEGLELGVARLDAALVLVIELAEADGHLTAARTWGGDHHQRARGLHIIVAAKAFLRVDEGNIVWVAFNNAVVIYFDAHTLQTLAIGVGAGLSVVVGDHH